MANSMSEAVRIVIDGYQPGHRFYGNQLKDDVVRIYPEAQNQYPDTILRMARRHRRDTFRTVNHNASLYEKVATVSFLEQMKQIAEKAEEKKGLECGLEPALQIDLL
jgi:hypothetical protein